MENINKKMRPQIIELEIGETVSFPIEKMKEMTDMMGGQGDMGGYFDEQGK